MVKALCILFIFLSSCMGPRYEKQLVPMATAWRVDTEEGCTLCNFRWWEQFQDPVLDGLIITALRNNQDLQVAISRVFEFCAHLGVVNANLYPAIDGNFSYTRTQVSEAIPEALPSTFRITNDYQLFFSLTWELDFWGRFRSASQAAYAELLSKVEARRAVVLSLVTSVADAYITLRTLDAQLIVSKETLESRKQSLKLAESRFQLGETSELEVIQAKAELEVAAIRVLEFERAIPQQENLLSILIGEVPQPIERGKSINALVYPVSIPAGLPSDLLTRRPDIVEAEDSMIAANARVWEARALYFPQITLTGMFGNESARLRDLLTGPAQMWQYGISGVQTLFDAGRTYFQVQEAKAIRDETLFTYRQTILTAFREVNDALIATKMNLELLAEHKRQVLVLGEYLHLAQLRYYEGETDYLNVLDAERSLFDAELQLVQAQADTFSAVVELYGALGGGWVTDADEIALTNVICD